MTLVALGIVSLSKAAILDTGKHPVRQEIVDQIKARTDSWTPQEVDDNHLKEVPAHKLQSKLGFIGYDSAAQFSQRGDNILGKILGELNKASSWMESTFNLPSLFPTRPLT